LTLVFSKK